MMTTYRVQLMKDSTYEVLECRSYAKERDRDYLMKSSESYSEIYKEDEEEVVFQGSIADCEAFIRLREKGQI